jgi:hypothetical protein
VNETPATTIRALLVVGVLVLGGCKESPPKLEGPALAPPSATEALPTAPRPPPGPPPDAEKFPLSDLEIAKIVNPGGAEEYTGPTGGVEGVVRIKGDPPLPLKTFAPMPKGCEHVPETYGPPYRSAEKGAGEKGTLGDALVGVIGVQGFVRPSREDKVVRIKNCLIEPRTIDLSLGQRLLIGNDDPMPYVPQLAIKSIVQRVALQGMSPIPLNITRPGVYGLSWFAGALPSVEVPSAMVFVLPNAFHMVTQLDGAFRITGIPVGKARVTASHLGLEEVHKDVEIKAGEVLKLELVMTYKAPAAPSPAPKPSGEIIR